MPRQQLTSPAIPGGTIAGAPTTGTHKKFELWPDSNGVLWLCQASGTPGTWVQVGSGGSPSASGLVGDGSSTDIPVYHGLNITPRDACLVQCVNQTTSDAEMIRWTAADANTIVVHFATAPAASSYRVNVIATAGATARAALDGGSSASVATWTVDGGTGATTPTSTISGGTA